MNAPRKAMSAALVALFAAGCATAADLTLDIRDAAGLPVADAVFYAEPVARSAPPSRPNARAVIDQVNKEFVPRVTIVQSGTQVFFPNSDNIRHSIYSFSPARTFTTKLYSGREAPPVLFDRSGLVVLGCNIHDAMVAWVFIVDTPWFGKTTADGAGTLRELPPGEYTLTAAAPQGSLGSSRTNLLIEGGAPVHRTLTLPAGP